MTKLYRHPVQVQASPDGLPAAFRWHRRWYRVTSCALQEQQRPSLFHYHEPCLPRYRCETEQWLVCDLAKDRVGWVMERVWD